MSSEGKDQTRATGSGKGEAAALARSLVRSAWKGSLATASRTGGFPYASLVAVATEPGGQPLLLLSGLAEHTKNIEVDQRASVLIDGTGSERAALTGARVTIVGRIRSADPETARRRYLARHPDAEGFIDFADFKLLALEPEWAHLVAGFGRIVRLQAADVLVDTSGADDVIAAEPSILEHMNDDHSDALAAMAVAALSRQGGEAAGGSTAVGAWRMIGCDPEGFDVTDGLRALRLSFPRSVATADEVRRALVEMVRAARGGAAG